jgi:hypothetical protein
MTDVADIIFHPSILLISKSVVGTNRQINTVATVRRLCGYSA